MYHNTAQGLASLGRGNDSMLVHMTPREVGGLQRLAMAHGGSLTTNPKTGLPEAGFLDSILPMLAGGAAVALTGGAATPFLGLSEGALAALAGGATGALFGDPKRGLLMNAGLGALGGYGGGNLYSGLSAAGTAVPGLTPEQIAGIDKAGQTAYDTTLADETARRAYLERGYEDPIGSTNVNGDLYSTGTPGFISSVPSSPQYAYTPEQLAREAQYAAMEGATPPPAPAKFSFSNIDAKKFIKQNALPLGMVGIPALIGSGAMNPKTLPTNTPSGNKGNIRPYEYDPLTQKFTALPVYAAAAGGLTPPMQDTYPQARIGRPMETGGIAGVQEYAAGGKLLEGPGDGMSDSIPAVIKGPKPQRAALAQGEFVIPADVVSHLGNGSTDAGAKRLYAMMDKVRHARTGNKKQGRQINPDKYMPA